MTSMTERTLLAARLALACGLAASVAGCLAGPTYGTGKGSNEQLLEDITGVLSLGPKDEARIEYKPRPELVKTASAELPAPQDPVATGSNPAWPESPEERRARVRADATTKRDDPNFRPEVDADSGPVASAQQVRHTRGDSVPMDGTSGVVGAESQRQDFKRRLAQSQQGSPTTRRYLSEPPLEYRVPSATAPTDELGEDEWRKERDRKREARKKPGRSWADVLW